jgi:hemoglobin-like flavoprotein
MYEWVGECLLAAFAEEVGDSFTPRAHAAWAQAYRVIVAMMLVPPRVGSADDRRR